MLFRNPYRPVAGKVDPLDDLARQRGMPSAPATANAPTSTMAPGSLPNATAPNATPPPPRTQGNFGASSAVGVSTATTSGGSRDGAIDSLQQQHDAETKATMQQLAASRAQQLQDAASRSNLGGFGLSGAATGLETDTANAADRSSTLALADLSHKQHDEDFAAIQRQAALDDLEASEDQDINHDGMIGGRPVGKNGVGDGNPDNNPPPAPTPPTNASGKAALNAAEAKAVNGQGHGTVNDPYGGAIGVQSGDAPGVIQSLAGQGAQFVVESVDGGAVIVKDTATGNYFKFDSGLGALGFGTGNDQDVIDWFNHQVGGQ